MRRRPPARLERMEGLWAGSHDLWGTPGAWITGPQRSPTDRRGKLNSGIDLSKPRGTGPFNGPFLTSHGRSRWFEPNHAHQTKQQVNGSAPRLHHTSWMVIAAWGPRRGHSNLVLDPSHSGPRRECGACPLTGTVVASTGRVTGCFPCRWSTQVVEIGTLDTIGHGDLASHCRRAHPAAARPRAIDPGTLAASRDPVAGRCLLCLLRAGPGS